MTACALFSPDEMGAPIIISDTVITAEKSSIAPTRLRSGKAVSQEFVHLARKSYILNDRCAVAFTGYLHIIRDFLVHAKGAVDYQEQSERPIAKLRALANEYSGIGVIGAYVSDKMVNIVAPETEERLPIYGFGQFAAIGTGARDILNMTGDILSCIPKDKWKESSFSTAMNIVLRRLHQEIYTDEFGWDWGGFFECLWFNREKMAWQREGKALYIFSELRIGPSGEETIVVIDKVFCYDPGALIGRLLCLYDANHPKVEMFVLEDLMCPDNNNESYDHNNHWKNWRPETVWHGVSVGTIEHDGSFHHTVAFDMADISEDDDVLIDFDGETYAARVNFKRYYEFIDSCRSAYYENKK